MGRSNEISKGAISRRGFLQIAVGSIILLPTISSAAITGPKGKAYADEGRADTVSADSEIYVVSANELSVVVVDASQTTAIPTVIIGAHVKITSRYNGEILEGTTDKKGTITFDISELSEDGGRAQKPAIYGFNATIEITAQGYRPFKTGLYRIEGGNALGVPTQPIDESMPYPVSASFDGWDILYSAGEAAQFVSCTGNDIDHSLSLQIENLKSQKTVSVEIRSKGNSVLSTRVEPDKKGVLNVEFRNKLLQPEGAHSLPFNEDGSYSVRFKTDTDAYEFPITLMVSEAPKDAQNQQVKKDLNLSPFNDDAMFLGLTVPSGFPVMGGEKIKFWEPNWPVTVAYDPFGFIRVKASTPDWGYISDNGKKDEHGWKFHPRKTATEQYNKMIESAEKAIDKTFGALSQKDGKFKQIGFSQRLSFTAALDLIGAAMWSFDDKDSRGRATLQVRLAANYSFTEMFWAGPFPIGIRFSVGLNVKAAGQAGFITPSIWSFSKYRWDFSSTGFDLQIALPLSLAVGIGVPGVASVSIKGSFSITFYLHTGPLPEGYKDLPDPHIRLASICMISVELELLFYTQSHTLWKSNWPDWYNNWEGHMLKQGGFYSAAELGTSLENVFSDPKIIDSNSLAALAEFSMDGFSTMSVREEPLTLYELAVDKEAGKEIVQSLYLSSAQAQEYQSHLRTSHSTIEGSLTLSENDASQLLFFADPPVASAVGDHNYASAPLNKSAGVLSFGDYRGIKPSIDMRIASDILSASRSKIYAIDGSDWLVRVGVVLVGGMPRTRIIAEEIGTSEKRVLDFQSGLSREQYLDYDFNLCTSTSNGTTLVHMVVVSGLRRDGDNTPLGVAAASTVFSYVCCTDWGHRGGFVGTSVSAETVDACGFSSLGKDPASYQHHFSCPQIRYIEDQGYGKCVVSFLERASATPEGLLSDVLGTVYVGVGMLFFDSETHMPIITDMEKVRSTLLGIMDGSVTEASLSDRINGWHILSLKNKNQTKHVFVETNACASGEIGGTSLPRILALRQYISQNEGHDLERLVAVPGHDAFFSCMDGKLKKVNIVNEGGDPTLSIAGFGDEDLDMTDFGIASSGDILYWSASRKGKSTYEFNEEDEAVLDDNEDLNFIMGARIRNGKMCKPFTIGEVSHSIERLRSLSVSRDSLSFISSVTVDAESGKGEQWYTALPWVRCIKILGADPSAYAFSKGDSLSFFVMLRNEGNCFISGVTLEIREKGGESIGEIELQFSADTLLESEWNPPDDEGRLQFVEDDFALAPGMTSLYRAESVTIPKTWEGAKALEVAIVGIHAASSGLLSAQAEEGSIEFLSDASADASLIVGGPMLGAGGLDQFSSSDIKSIQSEEDEDKDKGEDKREKKDPGKSDSDGEANGSEGCGYQEALDNEKNDDKKSNVDGDKDLGEGQDLSKGDAGSPAQDKDRVMDSSKNQSPKTDDHALGSLPLTMLAMGGAAAMAAYSARRLQIERDAEAESKK